MLRAEDPRGWRVWAEVVWGEPRAPDYIGDMPHTWIGAEFATAIRRMLLRENGGALELFRAVPEGWWAGDGIISMNSRPRSAPSSGSSTSTIPGDHRPRFDGPGRTHHRPLWGGQTRSRRRTALRHPRRRDFGAELQPDGDRLLTRRVAAASSPTGLIPARREWVARQSALSNNFMAASTSRLSDQPVSPPGR